MRRHVLQTAFAFGLLALLSSPALVAQTRTLTGDFALGDGQELELDVKVGSVRITAGDISGVSATVELECKRARRCADLIEEVELVSKETSRGLELRVDVPSTRRGGDLQLEVSLSVPRTAALYVDVGVGQVEIVGSEESVSVDVGVGEVEVEVPEITVASVSLDTGVGDATLRGGGSAEHGRRGFVGKKVAWSEGPGHAAVKVDVGVGEIKVRLR